MDAPRLDTGNDDVTSRDTTGGGTGTGEDGASMDVTPPPPRDGGTTGGGCTPGEVHAISNCGNCGLYLQTCNAAGAWDPPLCQQDSAACAPGTTEQRPCETNGSQLATCTTSCVWSLGACLHAVCTAGQTETQDCQLCGKQTRTCVASDAGTAWTPFSACSEQGICAAGTTDVTTCGKCGTYSRTCNASCTWNAWGACQGEGECAPGAVDTIDCQILLPILVWGKKSRTCDNGCNWGDYSTCK
jgi:hypothetical protein